MAVFILLGIVWYSNSRDETALGVSPGAKVGVSRTWPPMGRAVDGMRVLHGRTRVNSIARSMADSGWDQGPASPAMDMRKEGDTYDVFFSLPEGIIKDSVRVTALGSVLTLTMKDVDSGKMYLQRIRIPCGVERPDKIQTCISNDVLRVRICPTGR